MMLMMFPKNDDGFVVTLSIYDSLLQSFSCLVFCSINQFDEENKHLFTRLTNCVGEMIDSIYTFWYF